MSRGSSPTSLRWQHCPQSGAVVSVAAGSGLMEGRR